MIGEAWGNGIEQGLSVLSTYPGYTTEVMRAACDAFRKNDYTFKLFSPKPTTINGTKLKGRVDTYIDAISLRRNLTISYRGNELLAKEIAHFNRIDVVNAANHHSIILNLRTLTFRPLEQEEYDWRLNMSGPYAIRDPVDLNLNDFPDVLQLIIEKGWTS